MKNFFFLPMMALALLWGCRQKQGPAPDPEIDPRLQIKAIHFPGISDKDVVIDPLNNKIYVTMPPSLGFADLSPTVEVSEDAKPAIFENAIKFPYSWCYPKDSNLRITLHRKELPFASRTYIVKPKASGPLTIAPMAPFPVFSTGDSDRVNIDLLNLYGNELPTAVIFTNKKTGEQITWDRFNTILTNKLSIWAYSVPFLVGEYDISLKLKNGTLLNIPQPLTVIRGKTYIEHDWYKHAAQPGKAISLRGRNLQEEQVQFQLVSPNGTKRLISSFSDPVGKNATLQIPATVQPGYYGLEMIVKGQSLGVNHRISVLRYDNQPFIVSFNNPAHIGTPTLVSELPMTLVRKEKTSVLFPIVKKLESYVVALVSELNPKVAYQFPLTLPTEAPPYFIISSEIPSGRYKAVIQELNSATKEVVNQSEPFERTIILE